jgi:hypothetical protein
MIDFQGSLLVEARLLLDKIIDESLRFQEELIRTQSISVNYFTEQIHKIVDLKSKCTTDLYKNIADKIEQLVPKFQMFPTSIPSLT